MLYVIKRNFPAPKWEPETMRAINDAKQQEILPKQAILSWDCSWMWERLSRCRHHLASLVLTTSSSGRSPFKLGELLPKTCLWHLLLIWERGNTIKNHLIKELKKLIWSPWVRQIGGARATNIDEQGWKNCSAQETLNLPYGNYKRRILTDLFSHTATWLRRGLDRAWDIPNTRPTCHTRGGWLERPEFLSLACRADQRAKDQRWDEGNPCGAGLNKGLPRTTV